MNADSLALVFAAIASVIALVSLYYVKSHVEKLRRVKWK
jgi:hypothetical protein